MLHPQCKIFHPCPYLSEFFIHFIFSLLLVVLLSTASMAFSSHLLVPVFPRGKLVAITLQL
jgi:hypothetical protein